MLRDIIIINKVRYVSRKVTGDGIIKGGSEGYSVCQSVGCKAVGGMIGG